MKRTSSHRRSPRLAAGITPSHNNDKENDRHTKRSSSPWNETNFDPYASSSSSSSHQGKNNKKERSSSLSRRNNSDRDDRHTQNDHDGVASRTRSMDTRLGQSADTRRVAFGQETRSSARRNKNGGAANNSRSLVTPASRSTQRSIATSSASTTTKSSCNTLPSITTAAAAAAAQGMSTVTPHANEASLALAALCMQSDQRKGRKTQSFNDYLEKIKAPLKEKTKVSTKETTKVSTKEKKTVTFPTIVHSMVTELHETAPHVAQWVNDGSAFVIHRPTSPLFTVALQKYFNTSRYASLQRQLNTYGWKRRRDTFYNSHFHRDRSDFSMIVRRDTKNKAPSKELEARQPTQDDSVVVDARNAMPTSRDDTVAPAMQTTDTRAETDENDPKQGDPSDQSRDAAPALCDDLLQPNRPALLEQPKAKTCSPVKETNKSAPCETTQLVALSPAKLSTGKPAKKQSTIVEPHASPIEKAPMPAASSAQRDCLATDATQVEAQCSSSQMSQESKEPSSQATKDTLVAVINGRTVSVTLSFQQVPSDASDRELHESDRAPIELVKEPIVDVPPMSTSPNRATHFTPSESPPKTSKATNTAESPFEFDGISFSSMDSLSLCVEDEMKPSTKRNAASSDNVLLPNTVTHNRPGKRIRMTLFDGRSLRTSPLDAATYPTTHSQWMAVENSKGSLQKKLPSPVERETAPKDRVPPPTCALPVESPPTPLPLKRSSSFSDFLDYSDALELSSALGVPTPETTFDGSESDEELFSDLLELLH